MYTAKRILIIDDEEVITFGFSKVLEAPGVTVDCAQTLEEVRNLVVAHRYDAALVDLRLSSSLDMEGFECIRLLRSRHDDCRILVLTAYGNNCFREDAEILGIDGFYEKPVEPEFIRKALEKFDIYAN